MGYERSKSVVCESRELVCVMVVGSKDVVVRGARLTMKAGRGTGPGNTGLAYVKRITTI